MDFVTGLALVGAGVAVVGVLVGAFAGSTFSRLTTIGTVLALVLWAVWGILIYRGPDNPDLGEFGFTVFAGVVSMLLLGAWVVGLAVGRVLRKPLSDGAAPSTKRLPRT